MAEENLIDRPTLHEVVEAMTRTFDTECFPASKSDLAEMAGGAAVGRVPLLKFVQGLPERRYPTLGAVEDELRSRWRGLYSMREAGWEGAPGER